MPVTDYKNKLRSKCSFSSVHTCLFSLVLPFSWDPSWEGVQCPHSVRGLLRTQIQSFLVLEGPHALHYALFLLLFKHFLAVQWQKPTLWSSHGKMDHNMSFLNFKSRLNVDPRHTFSWWKFDNIDRLIGEVVPGGSIWIQPISSTKEFTMHSNYEEYILKYSKY